MKSFMSWPLIPAAAILLSACNAVIVDSYPSIPTNYNEGDFELATTKGAITTIVVGNPFSTPSGIFSDKVRALMKDQVGEFPSNFVPQHGANTTKPFKVVVVFNPRENVDNGTMCRTEKQTPMTANNSGQVSVAMVFCDGENLKSGTSGRISGVKDQSDPIFTALVHQVANAMIPASGLQQQLETQNQN